MNGTSVRQPIIRISVLPTQFKGTQVKTEIGAESDAGFGADNASFGISQAISSTVVHQEINGVTTVRPSIVRSSVLPTIDGGTTVLPTIHGGVRKSVATSAEAASLGINISSGEGAGAGFDLGDGEGSKTLTTTTTTTQYNLGTILLYIIFQ